MSKILRSLLLLVVTSQAKGLEIHYPFADAGFGDGNVDTLKELDSWLQLNYVSGDVSIYIAPGYYQDAARWNFSAKPNVLLITAEDANNPPVFDACLNSTCIAGAPNGYFLRIEPTYSVSPALGSIKLQNVVINNYVNGVYVNRTDDAEISNNTFNNIGSAFNQNITLNSSGKRVYNGYGVIHANKANNLIIASNHINNAYNDDRPLLMHALYVVNSQHVSAMYNNINMISGDPIRIRNGSENITLQHNNIMNSGSAMISTFEQAGQECPSSLINASFNQFGLVFPYHNIYSQVGFDIGWANKAYLKEGMAHGRGFKVTVDPQLSPPSCAYHTIAHKMDVFSDSSNALVAQTNDSRIINASSGVELAGGGNYLRILAGGQLVVNTNQHFVACSSSTVDTCEDNGTSNVNDDIDGFNSDDPLTEYTLIMRVKSGAVDKSMELSGAGLLNYGFVIPANLSGNWFDYQFPQKLRFNSNAEAILVFKAINSGPFIETVRLQKVE